MKAAIVSYRLGSTDGVSIEAAKWIWALESLGVEVVTVAGTGKCDVTIPGLRADHDGNGSSAVIPIRASAGSRHDHDAPYRQFNGASPRDVKGQLEQVLDSCDFTIAENICSLPINQGAYEAVATCLAGRPAIIRHHDLAIQRPHLTHFGPPPDDPSWLHVTINRFSQQQLCRFGIDAKVVYNHFAIPESEIAGRDYANDHHKNRSGMRRLARETLGVGFGDYFEPGSSSRIGIVALQPTRAIPRKNVPGAVKFCSEMASQVNGRGEILYWLAGPAEDGYESELEQVLASADFPVLRGTLGMGIEHAYAASDLVLLPSTWEGFGNPAIESACNLKPLVIGDYPVASELKRFGFRWFGLDQAKDLVELVLSGEQDLAEITRGNHAIAAREFNLNDLPGKLAGLIKHLGLSLS